MASKYDVLELKAPRAWKRAVETEARKRDLSTLELVQAAVALYVESVPIEADAIPMMDPENVRQGREQLQAYYLRLIPDD